jgi:LAGLIDADG-like domain
VATPILTTAGWKTMTTIEVGDQVYHPGGHPIDVTDVTPVYTGRPCYQVETTDGRSVVCDGEHQWTVNDRRSNRGWEVLSTGKLVGLGLTRNKGGGGKYAFKLPSQQAIISKPADLPVDPYLLGAWLGDGTTGKSEITCIESEADELTKLLPVTVTSVRAAGNARRINFRITPNKSRDGFPARCRELGIWTSKRIPNAYLTAGTEQRLALLQGLCDTDGSIDPNGRVRFCSTRKEMAEQVLYLARSLGWRATITTGVSSYGGKVYGASYCISWTHNAHESPPFRLRRKLARVNTRPSRAGERTAVSIRSITPVDSRAVRCITVDSDDHLWLAGRHLLPTRNCQWVDAMQPGVMPAEHWSETMDHRSRRAEGSPLYAALDVNYERSRSYVAIAARRKDGNLHIEVVSGARGTDWVIPWLAERKDKFAGVAVQKTGAPASGLIEDLKAARVPVAEWGPGGEVAAGSELFYDQISQHRVFHRPAPVLDRAAASGVSRRVVDGWVFSRRESPVDVSPLIACAAAVWLEHKPPRPPPEISPWPDEDTLAAWEAEAEAEAKESQEV